MGKFPVYQSPALDEVEAKMRPTPDYLHGYLGHDPRKLIQILAADRARVSGLGLSDEIIADRLSFIAEQAKKGLGQTVLVEHRYIVQVSVARGKLPCPWGHPGLFPKTHFDLRRADTDGCLAWTDLSVHMIREHGFYQGEGSPYRLDPEQIRRVLFD